MSGTIDSVTDWSARLLGRLYEQFKGLPNWTALVQYVIAPQAQAVEDVLQQLLLLASIDSGVGGVQLDVIGRIVGCPRQTLSDADYRKYLKGKILVNRSGGRLEELYAIFVAIFGPSVALGYADAPPAGFVLTLTSQIVTAVQDAILLRFMGQAKAAGVKMIFCSQEASDADSLWTDTCGTLTVQANPGDTFLAAANAASFPSSGSLVVSPGLANAETVTYTSIGTGAFGPQFQGIPAGGAGSIGSTHVANSQASLVGTLGLGLGDATNPATGGKLVSAAQA